MVCLTVNTSNSDGGVIGSQLTGVFIKDGSVVTYRSAGYSDKGEDSGVRDMCKDVVGKFDTPA